MRSGCAIARTSRSEVALDVDQGRLQIGQDLRAEPGHPRRAILERQRGERDDELAEVVARVEDLHRGTDARLRVVDENEVGVADVLEVELDDLVGAVHLVVAEAPAHWVEEEEPAGETLLGPGAPVLRLA